MLALAPGAIAQTRLGSEFQVNTYTTETQRYPSIATDADGDFIVVWTSAGQDGQSGGIFGQRFSSAGAPLDTEFQVNTYTPSGQSAAPQSSPWVAADTDGDFVVAWSSYTQDGSAGGVFARRFSSAGAPLTGELQINSFVEGNQRIVTVAADDDGDFVVAWETHAAQDGSGYGVIARRFSSAGAPLTPELQVNSYTVNNQHSAALAVDTDGDFVIAWQSYLQDGGLRGIFARQFSSVGTPLASEFQVNTYTTLNQRFPSAAADGDGDFVVAWESYTQDGSNYGIFARRFSSAGAPLTSELQVNAFTDNRQDRPVVAAETDGDFIVGWQSRHDGASEGVFARRFSSAGAVASNEFLVNTHTVDDQNSPSIAVNDSGRFVIVWHSNGQDGHAGGVFAQRFAATALLDIDGNGASQPLTDGLLVIRRFFGFTGATLTGGAVGAGCTRCDAAAIEPYIAGLGLVLDIDGNLATQPLTDGLLALRFLFGFTGATLTSGAVGVGCSRCDATTIVPYLAALTG